MNLKTLDEEFDFTLKCESSLVMLKVARPLQSVRQTFKPSTKSDLGDAVMRNITFSLRFASTPKSRSFRNLWIQTSIVTSGLLLPPRIPATHPPQRTPRDSYIVS